MDWKDRIKKLYDESYVQQKRWEDGARGNEYEDTVSQGMHRGLDNIADAFPDVITEEYKNEIYLKYEKGK
ncbi:hypothetical protein [Enterococcus sp. AZ180]|uniref:hypothetical protein n=1 Tax=Enterococcus sp. AZ180 TaxID=2774961 RepID=UPI003F2896E1